MELTTGRTNTPAPTFYQEWNAGKEGNHNLICFARPVSEVNLVFDEKEVCVPCDGMCL